MIQREILRANEAGEIIFDTPIFAKSLGNEQYVVSDVQLCGYTQITQLQTNPGQCFKIISILNNKQFIRPASESELWNIKHKTPDRTRHYNKCCWVTKNKQLRFQREQLRIITKDDDFRGYFIFHFKTDENDNPLIEVSYNKKKGNLKNYLETVTEQFGSVIEFSNTKSFDITYYAERNGTGMQFPIPMKFLTMANVQAETQLMWDYNSKETKIVIKPPKEYCVACNKILTSKKRKLSTQKAQILKSSALAVEFNTIKERLDYCYAMTEAELTSVRNMINEIKTR